MKTSKVALGVCLGLALAGFAPQSAGAGSYVVEKVYGVEEPVVSQQENGVMPSTAKWRAEELEYQKVESEPTWEYSHGSDLMHDDGMSYDGWPGKSPVDRALDPDFAGSDN